MQCSLLCRYALGSYFVIGLFIYWTCCFDYNTKNCSQWEKITMDRQGSFIPEWGKPDVPNGATWYDVVQMDFEDWYKGGYLNQRNTFFFVWLFIEHSKELVEYWGLWSVQAQTVGSAGLGPWAITARNASFIFNSFSLFVSLRLEKTGLSPMTRAVSATSLRASI